MRKRETTGLTILAIVIGLIVVVGLVWANHRFVSQDQGGNSFIAGWWGTRLYFTQGISPYSDEATAEIQKMVEQYGSASGKETAMFVAPFYAFIFYTPVALTDDIVLARTAWMTILEVALAVLIAFSLVLSRWRISLPFLVIVVLFSIAWYYSLRPIASGDLSMLSALLVTGAFLTIQADQDPVAGLLLALATIKPSMVLPLALLVLVWAISQRRWRLMWSFLASVALISAATSLLLPSWLPDYIRQLVELGKIRSKRGQLEPALELFSEALEAGRGSPSVRAKALRGMGVVEAKLGNYGKAQELLERSAVDAMAAMDSNGLG